MELTHGELKDWTDFRPSFLPVGKAGGRQVLCWQGFEVAYYVGTLAAVVWSTPSDFCNDGVNAFAFSAPYEWNPTDR